MSYMNPLQRRNDKPVLRDANVANAYSNLADNSTKAGLLFKGAGDAIAEQIGKSNEADRQSRVANAISLLNQGQRKRVGAGEALSPEQPQTESFAESLLDFNNRGVSKLVQAGATPVEALGLMKAKLEPLVAQRDYEANRADALFNQTNKTDTLAETVRNNNLADNYRQGVITNQAERNDIAQNQLDENSRHNRRVEVPNDIREAYDADYATGKRTTAGKDGKIGTDDDIVRKYLTKEDFAKYQEDKAKASLSSRVQSAETKADLISKAYKRFIDSLDEDQFEQYNKLDAQQKQNVLERFYKTGVVPYNNDTTSFYQKSNAGFDSSPLAAEPNNTEIDVNNLPTGYKTIGNKIYDENGKRVK